jgi:hypothetical protein
MPNEFKVKNGLIVDQGGAVITGSLIAPNITGSLLGTASYALVAQTLLGSVTSASFATTASYASNGGVRQLLAGSNITLSPTTGLGQVTISSLGGGSSFNTATGSYGSFYDTTTQTNPVANIPRSMSFNTTDITNGVSISGSVSPFNTYIKTENVGVYNIQFSAQLDKTDGGADEIIIWLRKNGIDLTDTATTITLTGNNGKEVAAWNWFANSAANDYYQIIWQSADTNVRLFAEPADGHPGIPSVIVTVNRVDQFLSNTGSFSGSFTGNLIGTASFATTASYALSSAPTFIDNFITVGQPGSNTQYNSIKTAVDSIIDASVNNTYTVKVYPGLYLENTITIPSYVAIKGESSTSTVVSASNPSASIFVMSDQTMVIDMQIQGSTAPGVSAIYYSSPTTPQTNAIAYAENIRFGTNYTNATCAGSGSGNCILQCSNVKYGGFTDASLKSFDIGFRVTGSGGSIGRMQLRNVTSTNGGVAGSDNNQIFALADAPGCTFIVNGCLLTRATGTARGTGFKVYNGGQLRLTAVNFQRWINGIWAPQTGSAPSIDAIALNFENCTVDTLIEHTGSIGKVSGTDNFLKTQIALDAPLYEVGQDPRKISVAKKGGDFNSVSASVAYITDSSENNRYIIEVGPGAFTEKEIDLSNKPYVSIIGSDIQATEIVASGSNHNIFKLGNTSQVSFVTLRGAGAGYAAFDCTNADGFALIHKISIYDCDYGVKSIGNTATTTVFGEYVDINGTFSYGTYVSSSNGISAEVNMENYYLFPSASAAIGNFAVGPSSSLSLYTSKFIGDATTNSVAIKLQNGSVLEATGLDINNFDYGYVVPNIGIGPEFRVVGSMIHDITTYDFDIQNTSTRGRYQGVSNHQKINNVSENFYWNFLDDEDGENDVTRKLSVTFADGTHTDATTLIFKGSPMGSMQGGTITLSSGLTITTAAGFGYLQDTLDSEVYKRIDWNNTNITLTANTNNYIYLNDAGVLSAAGSAPDSTTNIILGRVVTNNTGVEFIDQTLYDGEHMSNKLSKFNRDALGPVFAEGSIVTEDVVPFKLDVTQGNYYFSENNFLPAGTSSINLNQYYISSSAWARFTSSIVPNNVYASGSQLVPMSSSYYTKHSVYLVGDGVDEKYFLVINNNQYASLVQAEGANLPIIPTYFNDGVVPLASVYVQSGSANITQIEDIRPVIGFKAAGVNASATHGNLLGLTADDHLQYLLVNGTRQMSGDLGLGGNDIYNASTINAQSFTGSFTGSLFGTASFATNAATAVTASYVLNAVSASFATTASFAVSSSRAVSSSFALTASFLLGGGSVNPFPFTGSAIITGSLTVTGSLRVTAGITGSLFGTASFALNAVPLSGTINASPVTGRIRTTNNYSIWKEYSNGGGSQILTTGLINNNGTSNIPSGETDPYLSQAIHKGFIDYVGDFQTAQSILEVASTEYDGGLVDKARIYAESISQLGVGAVSSKIIISASQGLVGAADYSAAYTTNSFIQQGYLNTVTSSLVRNSQTSSMSVLSSSFATTASFLLGGGSVNPFPFTGSAIITGSLTVTGSLTTTGNVTVAGTLTAQTLVVQTITSSTDFVTGSTRFGSLLSNTHQFTGSVSVTGSLTSPSITGSLFGTSSWAQNAITASYVLNNSSTTFTNQSFTATAAQTTFTISGGYTPGLIVVFYNGSKLATSEYTASNGTTVVLGTAAELDDIIDVNIFTTTDVLTAKAFTTITYSGTPNWDYGTGYNKQITLTGAATLSITNDSDGDYGVLFVTQDGVGGRILTLPVGDNSTGLSAQTIANSIVIYSYVKRGSVRHWNASNR